ncbi:MAG: hypothetical protein HYW34_03950 [Candidatus Brennerbacteria bacterium]|nr:hypothetical protein [Candidatus Brennerbacteria bacterium]
MKKWIWILLIITMATAMGCGFPAVYRDSADRFWSSGYSNTKIKLVSNASAGIEIFINEKKEEILMPGDFLAIPPTAGYNIIVGRALTAADYKFSQPKYATIRYYNDSYGGKIPYIDPAILYFEDSDFPAPLIHPEPN